MKKILTTLTLCLLINAPTLSASDETISQNDGDTTRGEIQRLASEKPTENQSPLMSKAKRSPKQNLRTTPKLKIEQLDLNQSEKEDRIVVLVRDIEHLEWDFVVLENQLNEMRASNRVIQKEAPNSLFYIIGEEAHRCFEHYFRTKNSLQNKREQLEQLLNNQ